MTTPTLNNRLAEDLELRLSVGTLEDLDVQEDSSEIVGGQTGVGRTGSCY